LLYNYTCNKQKGDEKMNQNQWERWQDILIAGYVGARQHRTGKQIEEEMFNDREFIDKLFPSPSYRKSDSAIYQHILFIRNIMKNVEEAKMPNKYEYEKA
jgi:hypothetical protein